MQLLYRIYRTGTTVIVATHDSHMVDRMRRRVIELQGGRIIRDEASGLYAQREQTTDEFGSMLGHALQRPRPQLPSAAMRVSFFLREATRSLRRNAVPSFAAMASVLVTMLVLGVFIPMVQATTGAANEVRGKVLVDVFLKTSATDAAVERVRRDADAGHEVRRQRRRTSPRPRPTRARRSSNPEAYELLGSNPLPDTFRVTPDKPGNVGKLRDALAPVAANGERAVDRPGDRRGQEPPRRDDEDPLRHARREAQHGVPGDAAGARVDPADLEHDPPVAVRPPPRGRGHEARRRDGLVHPLAVRHRGHHRRRDRRRAWRSCCCSIGKIAFIDPLKHDFSLIAAPETLNFGVLIVVLLVASVAVSAAGSGLSLRRFLRV